MTRIEIRLVNLAPKIDDNDNQDNWERRGSKTDECKQKKEKHQEKEWANSWQEPKINKIHVVKNTRCVPFYILLKYTNLFNELIP